MTTRTIKVDYLARVEGEGALYIKLNEDRVEDVKLKIFEPPRFFEALLRGRHYLEAPDITSRICGICPIAYQMSACYAMEDALGVVVDGPLRALRQMIYYGEWIESHGLHVFMLHAPDFTGYDSAVHMAKDHPELVQKGLKLKKVGNDILTLVGGREIHPINVRVGGFYRTPTRQELETLKDDLAWACDAAEETTRWAATLEFPDFNQDYEFVSLGPADEYPLLEGPIQSNQGLNIPTAEFNDHFEEIHVEYSNALHCVHKGQGAYHVGPMARFNQFAHKLSPRARQMATESDVLKGCTNPFKSILIRCIEILHACESSLDIISEYEEPDRPFLETEPRSGVGHGCTEAPRGILYHRYELNDAGEILEAKIIPPTSQNQMTIEEDLRSFIPDRIEKDTEALKWQCEQAIRNYDPCISCATHFLNLKIDRGAGPS